MSIQEMVIKIKKLKEIDIADTSKDELLTTMVDVAISLALRTLYPLHEEIVDLPSRYDYWVIQAVGEMYQNLGNEAIREYSENGLKISFREMEGGVNRTTLRQLVPLIRVVGEEAYEKSEI